MRTQGLGMALICTLLLAAGTLAYITPIDSWNLRDYYDIIKVNEINGSTANFTTYEDYEGSSITDLAGIDSDTNASSACSGTTTYLDGEGNCDDISGVYVQAADWTTIDSYPTTCNSTSFVRTIGDTLTCEEPAYTTDTDTNASTACSSGQYLDGDGNCQEVYTESESDTNYVSRDTWTDIDNYPSACSSDEAVNTIADTLTCIDTIANATLWADYAIGGNQIQSADIGDVDDADVETDLNTYVDIAGDTMTGNLTVDSGKDIIIDSDNVGIWFGEDQDVFMYFDGTDFIIEVA